MSAKIKTFGSLLVEVVRTKLCVYCGACIATCPVGVVIPDEEEPKLIPGCIACQLCYYQCPRTQGLVPFPTVEFEEAIFGKPRDPMGKEGFIGVHRAIYAARTLNEELIPRCQDGGAATVLAMEALLSGKADCIAATGVEPSQPWKPIPRVLTEPKEVGEVAGTKYTLGPIVTGLNSAFHDYVGHKVTVVGVPCEVQALRRMQKNPFARHKITETLGVVIGLFCMKSYWYSKLFEHLKEMNVTPSRITRMAIKRGRFRVYEGGGEALAAPLRDLEPYTRDCCKVCEDFTAELADVSVGGVGVPDGWNLVIARTKLGEELVKEAVKSGLLEVEALPEDSEGLQIVIRLAEQKKRRPEVRTEGRV